MKLAELRKKQGLSQSALSRASGVPTRTIQCYEIGQRTLLNASGSILLRLSKALGCSIEDLLVEDLIKDDADAETEESGAEEE